MQPLDKEALSNCAVVGEILKGIAAYETQQNEILDAIKRHGGRLHQTEFDNEFDDVKEELLPNGDRVMIPKRPRLRVWPMERGSFLLGGMGDARSMSDWGKMLCLTQLMAQAGLLHIEGEPPNVVYIAKGDTR